MNIYDDHEGVVYKELYLVEYDRGDSPLFYWNLGIVSPWEDQGVYYNSFTALFTDAEGNDVSADGWYDMIERIMPELHPHIQGWLGNFDVVRQMFYGDRVAATIAMHAGIQVWERYKHSGWNWSDDFLQTGIDRLENLRPIVERMQDEGHMAPPPPPGEETFVRGIADQFGRPPTPEEIFVNRLIRGNPKGIQKRLIERFSG